MTNTQKAQKALQETTANREKWQAALTDAEAKRAEILDRIPASPDDLDGFADDHARAAGRITAAQNGIKAAERAILTAHENIVKAGAEDARAEVATAEREYAAHRRQLDRLLAKVSEFDGGDYSIDSPRNNGVLPAGTANTLRQRIRHARNRVALLEYVLEHGALPMSPAGTGIDLLATEDLFGLVPAYVHDYLGARHDAGLR